MLGRATEENIKEAVDKADYDLALKMCKLKLERGLETVFVKTLKAYSYL